MAQGYGQDPASTSRSVGWAFVVENPNDGQAATGVQYQVAAYDKEGIVLKTDSGTITVVLPTQKLGVAGSMYLEEGQTIGRLDVQVRPGKFEKLENAPGFGTEGVAYRPDRYSPKVVRVVTSPYTKDIKNVRTSAVAYDAQGNIIGGGFTYVDFVPASGKAAVTVSVTTSTGPARVELYPTLSGLSLLGN